MGERHGKRLGMRVKKQSENILEVLKVLVWTYGVQVGNTQNKKGQ